MWLVVLALLWLGVAVSYFGVSSSRRWSPDLVAVLALGASVLTALLVIFPAADIPYRVGGTLSFGALLFRAASISLGVWIGDDPDAVWISVSTVTETTFVAVLYAWWWLTDVHDWHISLKRIEQLRGDR